MHLAGAGSLTAGAGSLTAGTGSLTAGTGSLTACVCPRCQRGILAVRRNGVSGKPFWTCCIYGRSVEPCDYTEPMNGTADSTYLPAAHRVRNNGFRQNA